jgi:hypothetical protein
MKCLCARHKIWVKLLHVYFHDTTRYFRYTNNKRQKSTSWNYMFQVRIFPVLRAEYRHKTAWNYMWRSGIDISISFSGQMKSIYVSVGLYSCVQQYNIAVLFIIPNSTLYGPEFRTLKYYLNLLHVASWNSLPFIVYRIRPERFQIMTRVSSDAWDI